MTPTHHLTDEMLLDYAAGNLGEGESLIVAAHTTLCPRCRDEIERHDALGAAMMEHLPAAEVGGDVLAATLDRLEADGPTLERPRETLHGDPPVLPAPVRAYTGPFQDLPWRWLLPGVRVVELPIRHQAMPVRLFELAANLRVLDHGHEGVERTVVLQGGFTDDDGHFVRGDLCLREGNRTHKQKIDPGPPCIALVVADGPVVAHSLLGKLIGLFVTA